MAKKKKRKRRPMAPPVHSAPEAASHPTGTQPTAAPPARPMGAERPAQIAAPPRRPAQKRKKSTRALRTKRSKARPWIIGTIVALAAVAAIVGAKTTSHKASAAFNKVAASGGCGNVQTIGGLTNAHRDGQRIHYSTSPPAGGDHYSIPLSAGFYETPFSTSPTATTNVYRAVHSLEHGAVIVWYQGLSKDQVQQLKNHYDGADRVLVVRYRGLKGSNHIALTAWSKLDYCTKVSTKAIDAFVDQYKNASSAPERGFPI